MNKPIDFVITWVDNSDPKWLAEKEKYSKESSAKKDNRNVRYRDWNFLKYWFRCIEKNAPWVNKIYFITYGHLPKWLNTNNEKLVIVNHSDFIPNKYLPTFNSRCIEIFMNNIKGLSDNFVYFNDDMFLISKAKPEDFFVNNIPKDFAVLDAIVGDASDSFQHTLLRNTEIINKYYNVKDVIKNNKNKWYNLNYGKDMIRTLFLSKYHNFTSLRINHLPISYNKSSFDRMWELEPDLLNETASYRFRNTYCVNHWLIRDWQIASGNFVPKKIKSGKVYVISDDNCKEITKAIINQKYKTICINDSALLKDFDKVKKIIIQAFEEKYPNKSSFER